MSNEAQDEFKRVWISEDCMKTLHLLAKDEGVALRICSGGKCITKPFSHWVEGEWNREAEVQTAVLEALDRFNLNAMKRFPDHKNSVDFIDGYDSCRKDVADILESIRQQYRKDV